MASEIRTSFLMEFIKQLANNSLSIKKDKSIEFEPAVEIAMAPRGQISEIQEIEHTEYEKLGPREIKAIKEIEPYDPNARKIQSQKFTPSIKVYDKLEPLLEESLELKPLHELILDPTVESIECSGTEKNLVVKQRGKIVETSKKLKKEEIDDIINAFSSRSSTKAEEGILKTKVENLKIIVVLSKFAGDRFVIIKSR